MKDNARKVKKQEKMEEMIPEKREKENKGASKDVIRRERDTKIVKECKFKQEEKKK